MKTREVHELVDIFRARIVDVGPAHVMIEISGQERKIEAFIEAMRPAVERVAIIVGRDLVLVAVQSELAVTNAVAVSAHDRAKVGLAVLLGLVHVAVHRWVPKHHIAHLAAAVLRHQRDDARAVVGDLHFEVGILQRIDLGCLAVLQLAEISLGHRNRRTCTFSSDRHHG